MRVVDEVYTVPASKPPWLWWILRYLAKRKSNSIDMIGFALVIAALSHGKVLLAASCFVTALVISSFLEKAVEKHTPPR